MEPKELLLAEYEQYSDAYWKNEEAGERRITFFITLITAIVAALIALRAREAQISLDGQWRITAVALFGVLIFGEATFLRILQRDRVTDEYKGILRYLREKLRDEAGIEEYQLPFLPRRHWLMRGGLATTVALLNSFVIALMVAFTMPATWTEALRFASIGFSFLLSFSLHAIGVASRGSESQSQTFRAGVGAVILNPAGQVLTLERSDVSDAWQMPQGGMERSESPQQAVIREVEEETGIKRTRLKELFEVDRPLLYELPARLRSNKTGRGQVQYWFGFRFLGSEDEITLGDKKEFRGFRWMNVADVATSVVDFKKPVYQALVEYVEREKQGNA